MHFKKDMLVIAAGLTAMATLATSATAQVRTGTTETGRRTVVLKPGTEPPKGSNIQVGPRPYFLVADLEDGELKTDKLGRHYGIVKGAVEGTVLTILLAPIGGPLGLTVLGGIIGGVSHKGLGLHSDDRDRLSAALTDGHAAIGVLVKNDDAATVSDKLTELGGTPETHDVTDDVESAATTAAESAPA